MFENYKTKLRASALGVYAKHAPSWYSQQNTNVKIIIAIVVISTLWMVTGIFARHHKTAESQTQALKVKVMESFAQPHQVTLSFNGATYPIRNVTIKTEADGLISEVIAKDGQFLKAGDPILMIDEKSLRDCLAQAKALLDRQKVNFASARALYNKKLSSASAFLDSKSQLEAAEAGYTKAIDDLRKTRVVAPFDGYVDKLQVNKGDFVSPLFADKIALFYDLSRLKVVIQIPQKDIALVRQSTSAVLTHRDKMVSCNIDFISKSADPTTRSFRLEADCDNKDNRILAEETVRINIMLPDKHQLHYVAKSTLNLEMNGEMVIKTVEDKTKVKVNVVSIVDEDDGGFWVSGLPESADIITLGHQYVQADEKVDVEPAT